MRHGKKFNHLSRQTAHRSSMLANMACSLIEHKRINTTVAKAKALKQFNALTERSISTSLVLSNCLMCNDSSSYDSVCAISSASSVILSSENNMKW